MAPQLFPPDGQPSILPPLYQPPVQPKPMRAPQAATPRKQMIDTAVAKNDVATLNGMNLTGSERAYVARQKAMRGSLASFNTQAEQASAAGNAAYNAKSGGSQGVVAGMNPKDLKEIRAITEREAKTNPISPAAVVPKLAGEVAAVGPGLVQTAINAYHHPVGTAEQVGKATYHSFGETFHHPFRQLGQDPLGLVANASAVFAAPGAIAGRAAGVADAARAADVGALAKVGKVAKAAVQQPRPVERTLVTARDEAGNATHAVHPLGSINYSMGMLQKHVVDPIHQFALDNPAHPLAKILNSRLVGPQVKVGREIRAAERVKTAADQAPAAAIARAGKKP